MPNRPGDHIWYELITIDTEAAKAFYGKVIGWTAAAFPGGVEGYEILSAGDVQVAGLMSNAKCPDMRPGWFGYVAVADVDAKAKEAETLGGKLS
jgi:predicted enzyme related to lactoylglutathione lyase